MQFFKIIAHLKTPEDTEITEAEHLKEKRPLLTSVTASFNGDHDADRLFFFPSHYQSNIFAGGAICEDPTLMRKELDNYLKALELDPKDVCVIEITFNHLQNILRSADRMGYIDDRNEIEEMFGLDVLGGLRK